MKTFYFSTCFCLFICCSYGQIKISKEAAALQKMQVVKGDNTFLNMRAAFELYKKTNKSANTTPAAPAGNPKTYTFTWPQMKDEDNTLFFEGPIPYANDKAICLTTGIIDIQIPNCQAPGFYLIQLNCSFQNSGIPEINIANYAGQPSVLLQSASAAMNVTTFQQTVFVFGMSLERGRNELAIKCPNNTWFFQSLKIQPLQ